MRVPVNWTPLNRVRFRDRSGTLANGITRLVIGGPSRTRITVRARNVNLSGGTAGLFTTTLDVGPLTLTDGGVLGSAGTRLLFP